MSSGIYMIKLTASRGTAIWVNVDQISAVVERDPSLNISGSVVCVAGDELLCRESVNEVMNIILDTVNRDFPILRQHTDVI